MQRRRNKIDVKNRKRYICEELLKIRENDRFENREYNRREE